MVDFGKPWALGFLLILAFVILGELLVVVPDYVFHRLGTDRDALLFVYWAAPISASFVASYYSKRHKLLAGLSYIFLFPLIGAVAHYLSGELGGTVDFVGFRGAILVFKLDLAVGSILAIAGTALGLVIPRRKAATCSNSC